MADQTPTTDKQIMKYILNLKNTVRNLSQYQKFTQNDQESLERSIKEIVDNFDRVPASALVIKILVNLVKCLIEK